MVYIFFLFATVKPPVNSPGWFTCLENNVRHTALIEDEWLQERLFVSVKPTSASSAWSPPPRPFSASDTLFGLEPKCRSAASPDFLLMALVRTTVCIFRGCVCVCVCVCLFVLFCVSSAAPKSHTHLCKDDTCPHTCAPLKKDNSSSADTRPADGCWVLWLRGVFVCWGRRILFVSPWICN